MLQPIPSRYAEMKEAWVALAQSGDSFKSAALNLLAERSEWRNGVRSFIGLIDGHKLELREIQVAIDTLVENFVHVQIEKPEEKLQITFLTGKRLILSINDNCIIDQSDVEDIASELLMHAREKIVTANVLLGKIAGFHSG
jgi:hypothetical protein